ncbi:exodeoxyribonuclease VII large subunit [Pacificibacter maritimus]|uniref:Exodeoxyribonuclease 7 large subunit n=1 Tax=Pacificibacter maritimus TaxID=762213 RepID=A0A3N4UU05_9RHOB|nr:exodeoxyribonuclease VII large subunit [Pacificibacter maritimus]RPE71041.1 exodeoxyribonuclease VII large subunit [Pacificibacter maritimus]
MSDLFEDDAPNGTSNAPEFSVSELSGAVKKMIEGEFGFVRVRAEVGRVSLPRSGHMYFDLKDDKAVINAVSWKGQVAKMEHRPEEGMEVIATGRMTTFPGGSRYQLIVESIEPAGAGALMAMLEKRKKQLAAEGLFDPQRKQAIPYLPEVIGVVTSPSGAVIRDILHRLRDRFPRHVLLWPVAVQGQNSAREVANAIEQFNALPKGGKIPRPDLLIVARGGGSVEDLWGFNEEIVVRAAAASSIPLISAVGHETDTTLIDFASDMRAPTPTAAAEIAVPVRRELWVTIQEQKGRMARGLTQGLERRRQRLNDLARIMPTSDRLLDAPRQRFDVLEARLKQALTLSVTAKRHHLNTSAAGLRKSVLTAQVNRSRDRLTSLSRSLDPSKLAQVLQRNRQGFGQLSMRLSRAAQGQEQQRRQRLERLEAMRQAMGYEETLRRGYAVVRDAQDQLVTSADQADRIAQIQFADGRVDVGAGREAAQQPAQKPVQTERPKPKAKPVKGASDDQGSLF